MTQSSFPASHSRRGAAPPEGSGQIRVWLTRPGCALCEIIEPEQISEAIRDPQTLVWVDVQDPGEHEIDVLRKEFHFHRLALEDVVTQRQRPKVDEYPDYFFVVMYAPMPATGGGVLHTAELDFFVGKNYVVTSHYGEIPALQQAMVRWERTEPQLRDQVGFLLHVITDTVIDGYFPIVDEVEDRLDRLEISMFSEKGVYNPEELLTIKRTLYTLRKTIYPLRDVFNVFLRRDQMIFSAETYPYFQDAYDHVLRLLDTVDIERDMATGALEAQLSVVSNRLNETMKRLTVIAICVAILSTVFGAWGMNFSAVPLDRLGLTGFAIVTGGTLALLALALGITRWYRLW